jgi:cytochrome c oxidase accessory protein FixG
MAPAAAKIHPSEVSGPFRRARTKVSAILVLVFLALPWIKIGGHPVLLLDVAERKFTLFGAIFGAQDAPLILFLAGIFVFAIMLVTAVFGRVWCGWACPQTVFVDRVFRRIETWVEGDAVSRRRLDAGPSSFDRFLKKSVKWALFTIVGAIISHSFLAYFTGTDALAKMVASSPAENPASFLVMTAVLGFVLFDFGWFRERFCTHVCPYGRLQTVLLDEDSWVVAYDAKRGEPRRGLSTGGPVGDCVSCNKCVAACPTGIDIRDGLQLECIACTGCMDACDSVMRKIGKPEGLIRYSTLRADEAKGTRRRPSLKESVFRARPVVYFTIVVLLVGGFAGVLATRRPIDAEFIRAIGSPYDVVASERSDPDVINRFNVEVRNRTPERRRIEFEATGPEGRVELVSPEIPFFLAGGERRRITIFFKFPKASLKFGKAKALVTVRGAAEGADRGSVETEEVRLVGPF